MAESAWDETVILDATHLSGFTGGDTDFERQVLDIFRDSAPGYLAALRASCGESWKSDAHKLKGAARSIGAWRLARAAERAEFMGCPGQDDPKRVAILDELDGRLQELMGNIAAKVQAFDNACDDDCDDGWDDE